jgi:tetratricopeptide (TPR) repeat protein
MSRKFIEKWGSNPEGVWLKGENIKEREIKFPINTDLYVQSLERAFINIDDEEYDFALENLKLALANFKSSDRKGYEKITQEDLLNMAGNLALTKNELEEAKTLFEKQLEVNPNSSNACFGLGEVFNSAEMYQESKTMLEWAIINDEDNSNAKIRLGEVNQKLNLPEDHNSLLEQEKVGAENNA